MIQANELRKENWIKYEGNHFQVSGILEEHFYIKLEDGEEYQMYYDDDVYGIPLTPDVLEKCGFVMPSKYDHHGGMLKDVSENVAIRLKPLVFVDGYYWDNFNGAHKVIVKYLHQLQNIIYFLSGEEINYKP